VRLDRVAEELEEPLKALRPGLERLAVVLEDPIVEELPDTLRKVQSDVLPVLQTLADTHARVAFIAGSTERIMGFVEDTSRTFGAIPGAALLGRRRPPTDRPRGASPVVRTASRPGPLTAAGSLSARNCRMRSASGSSPMAAAARPRACSARRKPRLGSCDHGTGP
jgi:hypothetical protein